MVNKVEKHIIKKCLNKVEFYFLQRVIPPHVDDMA